MSVVQEPILVATDDSVSARQAVECAVQLAQASGSPLRIVGVWTLPVAISAFEPLTELTELEEKERRRSQVAVRRAAHRAKSTGVLTSTAVRNGAILEEICAEAQECGARLLVVGAHGSSGAHASPIGSVALDLLVHAPCPVLVLRGDPLFDEPAVSDCASRILSSVR